jgi:hypothetical protein
VNLGGGRFLRVSRAGGSRIRGRTCGLFLSSVHNISSWLGIGGKRGLTSFETIRFVLVSYKVGTVKRPVYSGSTSK